jgi:FkbM family methyltransferase
MTTENHLLNVSRFFIQKLPFGRYRAMNLASRIPIPEFIGTYKNDLGALKFLCNLKDKNQRETFFSGQYEPLETFIHISMVKPGMTYLDVGANWGYFSLLAAHLVGESGKVICVEADPKIHERLLQNINLNRLENIRTFHLAASDLPGELSFEGITETDGNWGVSQELKGAGLGRKFKVKSQPMDELLADNKIDSIDFLKMDIEGGEAKAVLGLLNGIQNHVYKRVLMEIHPEQIKEMGFQTQDVCQPFLDAGYICYSIDQNSKNRRQAAYAKRLNIHDVMKPKKSDFNEYPWGHLIWLAPGIEL